MKYSFLKTGLSLILFLFVKTEVQAQHNYWSQVAEQNIPLRGKRQIVPQKYLSLRLSTPAFKSQLFSAPHESKAQLSNQLVVLLPLPNGSFQRFSVLESPIIMEPLASNYPDMKTFSIRGIDDPRATGKLDWTEFGFHGMVRSPRGDFFIDPYCIGNTEDYISYYTSDFKKAPEHILPESGPEPDLNEEKKPAGESQGTLKLNAAPPAMCVGPQLKTYRLAVACTGEYAVAATGTSAPSVSQTLAKIVTSINRVDGVYETDASIRLVLVPTQTAVTFTSAAGDPFNGNNNAGVLINESQTVITNTIGSANYDIGHTFSTGGGGLAGLGVVCNNGQKARGITGSPNPVGDPYDIDYVAHEIGHQFRGNHTFNANTSSCNGNRNGSTAVEPGSGITIMAYAGICGSNDLAANSIAYFHAISYDEIVNFAHAGSGANCPITSTTGNQSPVVNAGNAIVIPKGTPFYLSGSASDPDGDSLSYSWEETDVAAVSGNWNSGNKPYFRSYNPDTIATRYFPRKSVVISGNYTGTKGEYLPSNAQTLNFRLTARDNKMGGGGVCYSNYTVTLAAAGPFSVSVPSAPGIFWLTGSQQTVTWDVNGTDSLPIGCSLVRISISLNNGNTYSVLVDSTFNDGSETVTVPTVSANIGTCRILVEAIDNVFYDISNNNFTITTDVGLSSVSKHNPYSLTTWPNPARTTLNYRFTSIAGETVTLILRNTLGQELQKIRYPSTGTTQGVFSIEYLEAGLYILELSNGKQNSAVRFVKE
jgi:hypothetical protein